MTDNKDKTSDQAKEIKKIQVIALKIVTRPISGMPYYEIMYIEVGKNDVNIGFGSLNFHNVLNYKEKYFELKKHWRRYKWYNQKATECDHTSRERTWRPAITHNATYQGGI